MSMTSICRTSGMLRRSLASTILISVAALGGCTTFKPPQISYDTDIPPFPDPPAASDDRPRPLHVPPSWAPAHGGKQKEAKEPIERIESANDAARVQPRKAAYFNAVQVFPYSPGALYQIYAAPGQITDIALEPGEQLIGSGPVAGGDTVRWVVGDTESGKPLARAKCSPLQMSGRRRRRRRPTMLWRTGRYRPTKPSRKMARTESLPS